MIKAKLQPLCTVGKFAVLVKHHWWQRYKPITYPQELLWGGEIQLIKAFTYQEAVEMVNHLTHDYNKA